MPMSWKSNDRPYRGADSDVVELRSPQTGDDASSLIAAVLVLNDNTKIRLTTDELAELVQVGEMFLRSKGF